MASDSSSREYTELVAKFTGCPELIINDAQFFMGKNNCIKFLRTIKIEREENGKCTALFGNRELDFLKVKGKNSE